MSDADILNNFTCGVCLEIYDPLPSNKAPKSLSCSHTFCAQCVATMTRNSCMTCPVCNQLSRHLGQAQEFPNNVFMLQMMESLNIPDKKRRNLSRRVCIAHAGQYSTLFCKSCKQIICEECVKEGSTHWGHTFNTIELEADRVLKAVNMKKAAIIKSLTSKSENIQQRLKEYDRSRTWVDKMQNGGDNKYKSILIALNDHRNKSNAYLESLRGPIYAAINDATTKSIEITTQIDALQRMGEPEYSSFIDVVSNETELMRPFETLAAEWKQKMQNPVPWCPDLMQFERLKQIDLRIMRLGDRNAAEQHSAQLELLYTPSIFLINPFCTQDDFLSRIPSIPVCTKCYAVFEYQYERLPVGEKQVSSGYIASYQLMDTHSTYFKELYDISRDPTPNQTNTKTATQGFPRQPARAPFLIGCYFPVDATESNSVIYAESIENNIARKGYMMVRVSKACFEKSKGVRDVQDTSIGSFYSPIPPPRGTPRRDEGGSRFVRAAIDRKQDNYYLLVKIF